MMSASAAAVAADPAVVSAKPDKRHYNKRANNKDKDDHKDDHHYLPKIEKPKSSAVRTKVVKTEAAEGVEASTSFPEVDFTTQIVVHTTADGEYVAIPRASASNIPTIRVPAAPEGENAKSTAVVVDVAGLHSGALIAINEWIEKKGPAGVSTTAFANPVTHTELGQVVSDEWEKEFSKGLLRDGESIIGCINFGEKNGLKGLQQFAIVALSCALRGKSAHEMVLATGNNADNFTETEIEAGRAAYPEAFALTKKRN